MQTSLGSVQSEQDSPMGSRAGSWVIPGLAGDGQRRFPADSPQQDGLRLPLGPVTQQTARAGCTGCPRPDPALLPQPSTAEQCQSSVGCGMAHRKDLNGFLHSIPKYEAYSQAQSKPWLPSLLPCGSASLPAGWGPRCWHCPCWLWLSCAQPPPRCASAPSTSRRLVTARCLMRLWRASSST